MRIHIERAAQSEPSLFLGVSGGESLKTTESRTNGGFTQQNIFSKNIYTANCVAKRQKQKTLERFEKNEVKNMALLFLTEKSDQKCFLKNKI